MAVDAKYIHLKDDSNITAVGSIFRGMDRIHWCINLDFSGKPSSSLRFNAVPILARRRVLNPTTRHEKKGLPIQLTVLNAQNWQLAKLKDCPAYLKAPRGGDHNQNCFVVKASGQTIYIPQLELARVLFYHDPFMARLSLQHNALQEDFFVDYNESDLKIYVREGAEYPVYYFNQEDNRRFLSWVLMDPHARQSFDSIVTNLLFNQTRRGNYDHWDFGFTPPPLTGVKLGMTGWQDRDTETFFVWEIHRLDHLPSSIEGEVSFFHPKYERHVGGKPTRGGGGSKGKPPEQCELDDEETTDTDKATVTIRSETVKISFKNPFITNRIATRTRPVNNLTGDGPTDVLGKNLSANEKEENGNLPGGAWNNLDDQTDDAHLYLSKFQSFLDMVELLESSHECVVRKKKIVKLPQLGEGKKHLLADTQSSRCLVIIELEYGGEAISLLEIDTSDGAAKLSTMMLKTSTSGWLTDNLTLIKAGIMKKSLGWPTDIFKKHLKTDEFSGVPHPKSKHSGMLKPEEIGLWAQRFVNWMSR
jgi:hypothetical protein